MQFELSPKQLEALRSPADNILYGGAAGAGKSHLERVIARLLSQGVPGIRTYLFRRTYPDLMRNHMEGETSFEWLLHDLVRSGKARWNDNQALWSFKNKSLIRLCHCQHEKDVWNYQGSGPNVLLFDEVTHFSEYMFRILRSFLRVGSSLHIPDMFRGKVPFTLSATNPVGIGAPFFKAQFYDKSRGINHIWRHVEKKIPELRQYIPATRKDNPWLDESYDERLYGMGDEQLANAMLKGDWTMLSGLFFSDAWLDVIHFIDPFPIPESWYVDRSFDWGYSKPYSVGWWAQSDGSAFYDGTGAVRWYPPGTLIRIGELYGCHKGKSNTGLREHPGTVAGKIREHENGVLSRWVNPLRIQPGPADTGIWDGSTGTSVASGMSEKGVHWIKADKSPGTRVAGWRFMHNLMTNSSRTNEAPGFYAFNTCVDFKRTVPMLPRDENNPDDIDTNSEDHIADDARYRALKFKSESGAAHIG